MTSTILKGIEERAARMGFHKKRMPPDFRNVRWTIACSMCPTIGSWGWAGDLHPDAMCKYARQKGWDVQDGLRPLCPACAKQPIKGPRAEPAHHSFKPFVPAHTAIFDGLLDAAVEKTRKEKFREATIDLHKAEAEMQRCDAEIAAIEADERAARAAAKEQAKRDRMQRRQAAREAGAEALRKAQLRERCGTRIPEEPTAPQAVDNAPQAEEPDMSARPTIAPAPKISHAVFQLLDGVFDAQKRLYRNGYTDQKVARECGTTEEIVAYLRKETFGDLAEDPRIGSIRDDLELLTMESTEQFAQLQKKLAELRNRIEQVARS